MNIIKGNIASPLGFSADGLHAGFKKKKLDFGWIVSEVPANVAGVFTTNKVIAAPLKLTKNSIEWPQINYKFNQNMLVSHLLVLLER